ncbi:MAG: hypothetical protein QM811_05985 [Pirellulales bacterium]
MKFGPKGYVATPKTSLAPIAERMPLPQAAKNAPQAKVPNGQIHHPISKQVSKALDEHPNLAGQYQPRDPRFTTQAIDEAAHRGY